MNKIGIWMDMKKAHIVLLNEQKETFKTVFSKIDFFHPKGGSRSKTKWGPRDVVQDSKYPQREKHQLKAYFDRLASFLANADTIALFGPSYTNEKFRKALEKNYAHLAEKVKITAKADSMTGNQVMALIKDFYKNTN